MRFYSFEYDSTKRYMSERVSLGGKTLCSAIRRFQAPSLGAVTCSQEGLKS